MPDSVSDEPNRQLCLAKNTGQSQLTIELYGVSFAYGCSRAESPSHSLAGRAIMKDRSLMFVSMQRVIGLSALFLLISVSSILAQDSPNIPESDAGGCGAKHGVWATSQLQGIPGDGNRHNFSVSAPNGTSQFLGGAVRGFRADLDNGYSFTCTINPAQPASVANSEQRRCSPPGNDMSVEKCTATNGSTGQLFCEYVNATNAPTKRIELGGCWK